MRGFAAALGMEGEVVDQLRSWRYGPRRKHVREEHYARNTHLGARDQPINRVRCDDRAGIGG